MSHVTGFPSVCMSVERRELSTFAFNALQSSIGSVDLKALPRSGLVIELSVRERWPIMQQFLLLNVRRGVIRTVETREFEFRPPVGLSCCFFHRRIKE